MDSLVVLKSIVFDNEMILNNSKQISDKENNS